MRHDDWDQLDKELRHLQHLLERTAAWLTSAGFASVTIPEGDERWDFVLRAEVSEWSLPIQAVDGVPLIAARVARPTLLLLQFTNVVEEALGVVIGAHLGGDVPSLSFFGRIKFLEDRKALSRQQAATLHSIRATRNACAHGEKASSIEEAVIVAGQCEKALDFLRQITV